MPPPPKIKEDEAFHLFFLVLMLPRMVSLGLITREQADELLPVLNDQLHKALGLK